jgi:hypothetical protein
MDMGCGIGVVVKVTVGAKAGVSVDVEIGAMNVCVDIGSTGKVAEGSALQAPRTIPRTTKPMTSCFKFVVFIFLLICKSPS